MHNNMIRPAVAMIATGLVLSLILLLHCQRTAPSPQPGQDCLPQSPSPAAKSNIVPPDTALASLLSAGDRRITEVIIHCTATPEGKDFTVADIRRWHLARGFRDIGYHYVVYRDGSVCTGRPLEQPGAHCLRHNAHSIGICYVGGLAADGFTPKDTRTAAQTASLRHLVGRLRAAYPAASLHGHCEFAAKACPCFDVAACIGRE